MPGTWIEMILSLAAQIAEMESNLNRPKKMPRNSSIPASQQPKAKQRQQEKKRGPKHGYSGKCRQRQDPDHTAEWLSASTGDRVTVGSAIRAGTQPGDRVAGCATSGH